MWHPGKGRLRAARSLTVGATVALIATSSHIIGGGSHTSWLAVLPTTFVVGFVTWVLAGRRLTAPWLVALLMIAQVGVHLLSGYLEGHAPWHGAQMLVSHFIAAALSALVLARGEFLLWWLYTWLRPRPLLANPTAPALPPRATATGSTSRALRLLLVGGLGRRGPPLVLA